MKYLLQPLAMISLLISFTACPGNSIVEGILSGAGIDGAITQETTGAATTDGTTDAESEDGEEGEDAAASSDSSDAWLDEYFSNDLDTADYSGVDDGDSVVADASNDASDASVVASGEEIPSDASADASTGSNDAYVATTDDIPAGDDAVADAGGADTGSGTGSEVAVGEDTGSATSGDTARTGSGATDDNEADGGSDYQSPVVDPMTGMAEMGAGLGKVDPDDGTVTPVSGEVACDEAEREQVSNTNAVYYMMAMPTNGHGRFVSRGIFETSFALGRLGGGDDTAKDGETKDGEDSGTAFDRFSSLSMALNQDSDALTLVGLTPDQAQLFGSATATDSATDGREITAADFKGMYLGIQGEVEAATCSIDLDGDGVGDKVIPATGIYKNLRVLGTQTADDGSETKFQVGVKTDGTFAVQKGMLASGEKFSFQVVNVQAKEPVSDNSRITVSVRKNFQLDLTVGKDTSTDTSDDTTLAMHFYPELTGKQFSKKTSSLQGGLKNKTKATADGTATDSATDTDTNTNTTTGSNLKVSEIQNGVKIAPAAVETGDGEEGYGFLENKVLVLTK